jgi:hypothetical protein
MNSGSASVLGGMRLGTLDKKQASARRNWRPFALG